MLKTKINNQLFLLPALVLLAVLLQAVVYAQDKNVSIRVAQENESIRLSDFNTNIRLQKKPFKILVMLENVQGVYVFASIRDSIYRFTETSPIRDFSYLPLLQLREDEFNENKEMNISETGWSYWFYDTTFDWHPFNRKITRIDKDRLIGTKNIRQFFDVNEGRTIKIRDIDTPLYLFFVAVAEYDKEGKPTKELMRRKVKVEWSNEE
ncbi:MAG TPA: hypothetical protein VFV31_04150 [Chitinophagaceae bacterium]|nr:hypothetical protein [Chitinophagaceae bacterium]